MPLVSLGLSAAFLFAQGWLVVAVYAGLTFCYSALAAVLPSLSTDLFGLPHRFCIDSLSALCSLSLCCLFVVVVLVVVIAWVSGAVEGNLAEY